MENPKDLLIEAIRQRSERESACLATEFARAASQDKEAILAELELERWVAESCEVCLDRPRKCQSA